MMDILVQKCLDVVNSSEIFGQSNLHGGRVFRDVVQYVEFFAKYLDAGLGESLPQNPVPGT